MAADIPVIMPRPLNLNVTDLKQYIFLNITAYFKGNTSLRSIHGNGNTPKLAKKVNARNITNGKKFVCLIDS